MGLGWWGGGELCAGGWVPGDRLGTAMRSNVLGVRDEVCVLFLTLWEPHTVTVVVDARPTVATQGNALEVEK